MQCVWVAPEDFQSEKKKKQQKKKRYTNKAAGDEILKSRMSL